LLLSLESEGSPSFAKKENGRNYYLINIYIRDSFRKY